MSKFSCLEDTDLDALFAELGIPEPDPEPTGRRASVRTIALDYQPSSTMMPGWTVNAFATRNRELTPEEAEARLYWRRWNAERIARMTPEELAEFHAIARERYRSLTPEQKQRKIQNAMAHRRRIKAAVAELAQKPVSALTADEAELLQKHTKQVESHRVKNRERYRSLTPAEKKKWKQAVVVSQRKKTAQLKELAQKPASKLTPDEAELLQKHAEEKEARRAYDRARYLALRSKETPEAREVRMLKAREDARKYRLKLKAKKD